MAPLLMSSAPRLRDRALFASRQLNWTCSTCRGRRFIHSPTTAVASPSMGQLQTPQRSPKPQFLKLSHRSIWSLPADDKPYYITTPIFYVNAAPHIGHLYSMFLADTLKRWQLLNSRPALLCTGVDEHGSKVQRAAELQGVTPQQLCDANAKQFQVLASRGGISHDFFVRTTEQDHRDAVHAFWKMLDKEGHIYLSKHAGWYSVSDEAFYGEDEVHRSLEPVTGQVLMTAKVSGSVVEWVEEETYRFRLTSFRAKLLQFYEDNPTWIMPAWRQAEVVDWVKNHLTDLSISRPSDRVGWGIRVPGKEAHTIYVWVDALVNYLTKARYPSWEEGEEQEGGWPADVHVIGKDILRFHCVYWPALLMATGLPLPQRVLVHGHWTMGGKKMSKSLGNVVNPFAALERWDADALRCFMIAQGCIKHDSDYSNEIITNKYQKHLQNGLGNLLSRVVRTNRWNVSEAVKRATEEGYGPDVSKRMLKKAIEIFSGKVPEQPTLPSTARKNHPGDSRKVDLETVNEAILNHNTFLQGLPDKVTSKMDTLEPVEALRAIQHVIAEANVFMTVTQPWHIAELPTPHLLHKTIFMLSETLRISGILLQPFMPTKATILLNQLGVARDKRKAEHARLRADSEYGVPFGPGTGEGVSEDIGGGGISVSTITGGGGGSGTVVAGKAAGVGKSSWDRLFPRLAVEDVSADEAIRREEERRDVKKAKKLKRKKMLVMSGIPVHKPSTMD